MPIVNGKYKNPGWVNGTRPPINAQNLNDISNTLEKLDLEGSSGKRTVRFVVGTSTSGWTAADCDYLCDGTADDVEINAALTTALQKGGGEVRLLAGDYNISQTVFVHPFTCLRGNGIDITTLVPQGDDFQGTVPATVNCMGEMADLTIQRTMADEDLFLISTIDAGSAKVTRTKLQGKNGIFNTGQPLLVHGCDFNATTCLKVSVSTNRVSALYCTNNEFSGNNSISIDVNVAVSASLLNLFFAENFGQGVSIIANGLGYGSIISNNQLGKLTLGGGTARCLVSGNTFLGTSEVAISLDNTTKNNVVMGNSLQGVVGDPTYVHTIQDNGVGNIVQFNSDDAGGGGVASFNGRTGAVTPESGDYTATQVGARPDTWTPTASDVGAVPTSRTVNGKPLTSNITLTADDVGAITGTYGTADLTPGTSPLTTGNYYFMYE